MVAELAGIPVNAGLPIRSSRNKSSASKIISNIVRRNVCYAGSSRSSSTTLASNDSKDVDLTTKNDLNRPRWIRNATREPIYSVLDDRDNAGSARAFDEIPSSQTRERQSREYEISAIRNCDTLPIYREIYEKSSSFRENRPNISACDLRRNADKETDEEEYALYSVVRKPPKQIFAGFEISKLPIVKEEEVRENPRDEILKKQRELHKWLESASASEIPDLEKNDDRDDTDCSKSREKLKKGTIREMNCGGDDDKCGENSLAKEKTEDIWSSPGISIPRGVIGMVGPFCRVYRNPNELRECMLNEEFEERAIDVPVNAVYAMPRDERKEEKYEYEEGKDDEAVSALDFVSETGTLVDERIKKLCDQVVDEDPIEEQTYRRRAKWRIIEEVDPSSAKIAESHDDGDKSTIDKESENDETRRDDIIMVENAADLDSPPKYTSRRSEASNEPHDKDSLNETGSTTGGTVEGNHSGSPARGERSGGPNDQAPTNGRRPITNTAPPRSLVSRILARARSSEDLLDHSEPYSQLWIVLSNVYGELVVVLMMALCLAEVMDTPVPLLSLQSVFLMYLYVGSIAVIISIYLWVLIDSCGSLANGQSEDAELGGASLTRFGSLKRAHISRSRTAPTSFYIRVGALLFGLATLVFNGLEMAMHSMMQGAECLSDIVFVHPVLHGLFTFLQMHFLFVNSQVLVERFGLAARFGFTHLAATNIAVWARLVIWDSAQEWTYFVHLAQRGAETSSSPLNLRGFPGSLTRRARDILGKASTDNNMVLHPYQPISDEQISQVVTLQECLNTNTLGQLWTSSMPFLYPFIVQFSLIAAAVTFVMGRNVGRNRYCHKQKFHSSKDLASHTRVGCDGSSKGLFLGILCMTAGIVVILIFLVVREDENFSPATLSWLTCGTLIGILALSGVMTASGLVQVRQMSIVSRAPATLDTLLSNVALFGVQLYSVFTAVVCACSLATYDEETQDRESRGRHGMLLAASILQLIQCFAQSTLIAETSKRSCITRFQMMAKPARQVITFLLFSNAVLWAFDTVVTQNWVSQELQLRFFGVLAWGIISRICLPLVVFYRFHSCVLLLETWNKCYRTPRGEHPLN